MKERIGVAQYIRRIAAGEEHAEHAVNADSRVEHSKQDAHENDGGNKVRDIRDRLNRLFKLGIQHRVHSERKDNRKRKSRDERIKRQHDGVFQHAAELVGREELFKIENADPRRTGNAISNRILLERNLKSAVHGNIRKDDHPRNRNQQEQIKLPALLYHKEVLFSGASIWIFQSVYHYECPQSNVFFFRRTLRRMSGTS